MASVAAYDSDVPHVLQGITHEYVFIMLHLSIILFCECISQNYIIVCRDFMHNQNKNPVNDLSYFTFQLAKKMNPDSTQPQSQL